MLKLSQKSFSTSSIAVPTHAQIVIVGGGVIGCSVAYHLSKEGKQVLLLERRNLTAGCTWHAAGLVGQLRSSYNVTQMQRESVNLYRYLSKKAGVDWKEVGSLRIASSKERWSEIKKSYGMARSFGFDMHLISPEETKKLCPIIETKDTYGSAYIPSDGYVDPNSLTMALAKEARLNGAKLIEGVEVLGFKKNRFGREERITHVIHSGGEIEVDCVVNCAGLWARDVGKLMGVNVPTINVQHQYLVTNPIPNLPNNLPTFRDPDYLIYYKPEVNGLAMGGWEPNTVPVSISRKFGPELYTPDFDRFQQLMEGAIVRTPILNDAGVKTLINGPIPISPDGEPIIGRTYEVSNAFVAAGFTAGVGSGGGAGKVLAEWIINGKPYLDLWQVDIRRFGPAHNSLSFLQSRCVEAYGDYYILKKTYHESKSARNMMKTPLYEILKSKGAVFGTKFGWERPNWFNVNKLNEKKDEQVSGYPIWWSTVAEEHRACRENVVLIDQSSFSKMEVRGSNAVSALQAIVANDLTKQPNGVTYTQALNKNGGIECDITVARLAPDLCYIVTGTAFGPHDFGWIESNIKGDVHLENVTGKYSVINIAGPYARKVLQKVVSEEDDISNENFPFMTCKNIHIGMAPVRALRVTFVGELGWELHIPSEFAQHVYWLLWEAGQEFSIRNAGYYAIDSLRCEKGYRVWGSDITPSVNPLEAGLGFCVSLTKGDFIGKTAYEKAKKDGAKKKFACFTLDKSPKPLRGNELILTTKGSVVGLTTSACYGYTIKKHIAFGYIPAELFEEENFFIEVDGEPLPAKCNKPLNSSLYDNERKKILC